MSTNPAFSLSSRPTSPTILIPFESQLYALPIQSLSINIEINCTTAFIRIKGVWKNIANYCSDCIFCLPTTGTVTQCQVQIQQRLIKTAIMSNKEVEEIQQQQYNNNSNNNNTTINTNDIIIQDNTEGTIIQGQLPPMSYNDYIPNLFRLPINQVNSTDLIAVDIQYQETLTFLNNSYHFSVPLTFSASLLPQGKSLSDVVSIDVIIHSVTPEIQFHSNSHSLSVVSQQNSTIQLKVIDIDKAKDNLIIHSNSTESNNIVNDSHDIHFSYSISTEQILPTCIKEVNNNDTNSTEEEGTFLLFVTPPTSSTTQSNNYSRSFIFLLDRSGSMQNLPWEESRRALCHALTQLRNCDYFTIVTFDHHCDFFAHTLQPVTAHSIQSAIHWLHLQSPQHGGTDIATPMQWALDKLNELQNNQKEGSVQQLKFIVLLTDGCVSNEREICRQTFIHRNNSIRILTLGIGTLCNWFFLKMLSQIGKGFSDVCIYKEKIYEQIVQLLEMTQQPTLTNITLSIAGVASVELYPFPLPDLFHASPLTVTAKYRGKLPEKMTLQGNDSTGKIVEFTIPIQTSSVIPVTRTFLSQRLSLLTARAWLEESPQIESEIIELSKTHNLTSAFTQMLTYETTVEKQRQLEEEQKDNEEKKKNDTAVKKWYQTPSHLAALSLSVPLLIGVAIFSFGDSASTLSNLPGISDLIHSTSNTSCCNCCEHGCGGCDCGACITC